MKHKITVTQEDIDLGVICSERNCPVAYALQRHFECNVLVGYNGISIETVPYVVVPPSEVKEFVKRFDNDDVGVTPFDFEIEIHE